MKKRLKAYIIDDEERAINSLQFLLDNYCSNAVEVIGNTMDFDEGLDFLSTHEPDVLFLDINLGVNTGFQLLHKLGPLINTDVIIVTAYDQHALEAFSFGTVSYLLKPIDPDRLVRSLERIMGRKGIGDNNSVL
ncbi:hypothetical protein DBR40_25790 [Pedobacter sp. KBW01]|uniref:LytR/AlgR family response regulator transcription factor n=1 Tax=Pedobacter sp. KBW01 TaxID=2153364 RepID=UPI000F5B65AB|nr:response regulator [Pedobacter sp. KBW01]RQO64353.1 hypothetical protein DBR40_25790 [Pedobacter sp. KBW01]